MTVGSLVKLRNPHRAMYGYLGLIISDHKNGSYLVYFDDYGCRTLCDKAELNEVSSA
jgi:hypothetical protein